MLLLTEKIGFLAFDYGRFQHEQENNVALLADTLAEQNKSLLVANDVSTIQENLNALHTEQTILSACVLNNQNNEVACYKRQNETEATTNHIDFSMILKNNDVEIGKITVQKKSQNFPFDIVNFAVSVSSFLLFSYLISGVILNYLKRVIFLPLEQLNQNARNIIAHKNYRERLMIESDTEISTLTNTFNIVIDALEIQHQALRQSNERLATFEQSINYPPDLLALASLHIGAGIEYNGGNVGAYRKQLQRFRQHFSNAIQELQRLLLTKKEISVATTYCESLKDVAGNIGATALYRETEQICNKLRRTELPNVSEFEHLTALLQHVFNDIDSLKSQTDISAIANTHSIESLLLKTNAIIQTVNDDLGMSEILVMELCNEAIGSEFQVITDVVAVKFDEFDIENAILLLTDLQKRLTLM